MNPRRTWARASVTTVLTCGALVVSIPVSEAAFPGRNGKIAFERQEAIYTVKANGQRVRQVAGSGGRSRVGATMHPAFSADGRRIAFASNRDDRSRECANSEGFFDCNFEIYTVPAGGGSWTRITFNADPTPELDDGTGGAPGVYDDVPAFSPAGDELYYARYRCPTLSCGGLFATDLRSGTERKVQRVDGLGSIQVSPNGRKLAYTQARSRSDSYSSLESELVISGRNGGHPRVLLSRRGVAYHAPDFAPNGRRIVYEKYLIRRDESRICTVKLSDKDEHCLTSGGAPAFSPDGRKIVFEGNLGAISVMNADGSRKRRLVDDGSNPSWQPLPG